MNRKFGNVSLKSTLLRDSIRGRTTVFRRAFSLLTVYNTEVLWQRSNSLGPALHCFESGQVETPAINGVPLLSTPITIVFEASFDEPESKPRES